MNNRPYLEEMIDAAKGIFALIRGEKAKLGYFNFSQTGLVGSFIAVLIGLALQEVFFQARDRRLTGTCLGKPAQLHGFIRHAIFSRLWLFEYHWPTRTHPRLHGGKQLG